LIASFNEFAKGTAKFVIHIDAIYA